MDQMLDLRRLEPPASPSGPRVVIAGLPYSENVGDGVVADCVAWALRADVPGVEVRLLDLAGRAAPGDRIMHRRATVVKALSGLPGPARRLLVRAWLARRFRRAEPAWREALAGADLVVIPGGQLFSDTDLNFPRKLARLAACAEAGGVPVLVAAAGVTRNWSPAARRLFRELLRCDLRFVGLRDQLSMEAWHGQFGPEVEPVLTPDPGLLARHRYGPMARAGDAPVGVGVAGLETLAYHADGPIAGAGTFPAPVNLTSFYRGLVLNLVAIGHRVRLFCNGSADDAAALVALAADEALASLLVDGRVELARVPRTGAELAELVGTCQAVVGHRLHSCVVAYAYQVPIVGLAWDRKVRSFFAAAGLDGCFVDDPVARSATVAELVDAAIRRGIDPEARSALVKACRAGLLSAWAAGGLLPGEESRWP